MKVVVLGSAGMAGHIVHDYLSAQPELVVMGIARTQSPWTDVQLDVSDFDALEKTFVEIRPKFIINCIGILVNNSKNDMANAILINSYLPHLLAKIGQSIEAKLIHISTDCVFSGYGSGAYTENSVTDGNTPYARTKALGEVKNERDLTIRTSIIGPEYKADGTGLLDWFLKQSASVSGFSQVFWSGVTTLELAKAIYFAMLSDVSGLVHLCPTTKISKADLLKLFKTTWHRMLEVREDATVKSDKSLVCSRDDFEFFPQDYSAMIEDLKIWMAERKYLYPHYAEL